MEHITERRLRRVIRETLGVDDGEGLGPDHWSGRGSGGRARRGARRSAQAAGHEVPRVRGDGRARQLGRARRGPA